MTRTRVKILMTVGVIASLTSLSVVGGIWLQHKYQATQVIGDIRIRLAKKVLDLRSQVSGSQTQVIQWRSVSTNLHEIQVVAAKISDVRINGGSLVEVGGNIVIASPLGQISYLDSSGRLNSLGIRVPMNLGGLREDRLYRQPLFDITQVRTHDLLAIQTDTDSFDLYASFSRFNSGCFEFVIGRISLEGKDQKVTPTGRWSDVWVARPCIRLKDRGSLFFGMQAGGRMVRLGDDKILVSVGDYLFDGFHDSEAVSMDPSSDLGKLVEIDVQTGAARQFAVGLRNPQGLAVARDGRIWETEHGPQGGDEVNLMIEGRNYGWPVVTYGMTYGWPAKNWPQNPSPGRHDGYERPRFAFVPSIGISNIVEPDSREFPNWEGGLLLCSLKARTLYLLRTEGDEIVYAEPLFVDRYRLRDIAVLRDGRIAILADGGTLLLVRNADKHRGETQHIEISGLSSLPEPLLEEAPTLNWGTAADRGRQYFFGACGSCHSVTSEIGVGPPLNGVVGRRIAAIPDFGYSAELARRGGTWTEPMLRSYVANPKGFSPGTSMPDTGMTLPLVNDVIAYLKTTHETRDRSH